MHRRTRIASVLIRELVFLFTPPNTTFPNRLLVPWPRHENRTTRFAIVASRKVSRPQNNLGPRYILKHAKMSPDMRTLFTVGFGCTMFLGGNLAKTTLARDAANPPPCLCGAPS